MRCAGNPGDGSTLDILVRFAFAQIAAGDGIPSNSRGYSKSPTPSGATSNAPLLGHDAERRTRDCQSGDEARVQFRRLCRGRREHAPACPATVYRYRDRGRGEYVQLEVVVISNQACLVGLFCALASVGAVEPSPPLILGRVSHQSSEVSRWYY